MLYQDCIGNRILLWTGEMMNRLLATLLFLALAVPASAQQITSSGAPQISGSSPLTSAHLFVGNASNIATDVAESGDCAISNAGAQTCTQTNGTPFGPYATATLGQLPGQTNATVANAGNIGQTLSSTVLIGSAVSLTTATAANVTSQSYTAGSWLLWGNVCINPAVAASTTTLAGWISTTSATLPTAPNSGAYFLINLPFAAGNGDCFPVGMIKASFASTTTVYLSVYAAFTGGTNAAYGYLSGIRTN